VLAGPPVLTTVADRLAGVAGAFTDHGLTLDDLPVLHTDFTRNGGHAGAERLLAEHPDLTALIALNDVMAIGVLSVLRGRGIAVPRQISVVGVDDVAVAADLAPSLTTVRLPMTEMGELAVLGTQAAQEHRPPADRARLDRSGPCLTPSRSIFGGPDLGLRAAHTTG
jgi:LacI family transcriptional regulator